MLKGEPQKLMTKLIIISIGPELIRSSNLYSMTMTSAEGSQKNFLAGEGS